MKKIKFTGTVDTFYFVPNCEEETVVLYLNVIVVQKYPEGKEEGRKAPANHMTGDASYNKAINTIYSFCIGIDYAAVGGLHRLGDDAPRPGVPYPLVQLFRDTLLGGARVQRVVDAHPAYGEEPRSSEGRIAKHLLRQVAHLYI